MLRDKPDGSRSYSFVLKDAKTPSWCIRIITTGLQTLDRISQEDGHEEEHSEAAGFTFLWLVIFYASKNIINY